MTLEELVRRYQILEQLERCLQHGTDTGSRRKVAEMKGMAGTQDQPLFELIYLCYAGMGKTMLAR